MIKVAVVILNYNGEKLLEQFLPLVVKRSSPGAQLFVADNGSTDGSAQLLKNVFPEVTLIELGKNYGFCGGYNRSIIQIKAEYFVLLNSDVEVSTGWLDPIINLLDQAPTIAAVQPKILSYHNKNKFEYAGAAGGFIDSLGYPFCRGRVFENIEEDKHQYDDERPVFWASGACMVIRSSVYHQLGGLDEDFFAHMEEIDLCWKINRAGLQVYYCGKSTVYHVGAGTLGYNNPFKTYLNFRNGLVLIFKHLGTLELLYKLPLRFILDWIAALVFLVKGQTKNTLAVLKAHIHFLKNIRRNFKKRTTLQTAYPGYPRQNVFHGLIIFNYFLKRKKVMFITGKNTF